MAKILITGGSGLLGRRITAMLLARGDEVVHLSREAKNGLVKSYAWNIAQEQLDTAAFGGVDHIIHLAGAGIADSRWTASRKKEILESRTKGTRLLVDALEWLPKKPKTFVSASAIGYYGDVSDRLCTEASPPGQDFLAEVCAAWEQESMRAAPLLRTAIVRIGIVLSTEGGALPKLMLPFRLYAGAVLGSGRQFMSWVHIDDLARLFIHLIDEPETEGIYNGVAPIPETHYTLMKALSIALKRPLWLWVPGIFLRLALGEMAITVLTGQQVSDEKVMQSGFRFQYGNIHSALRALLHVKS